MPEGTSVEALVADHIDKNICLFLRSARKTCPVTDFVVAKWDGDDFEALFLEEWATESIGPQDKFEVIYLENGYNKPLRGIESNDVLKDCVKSLPPPGIGDSAGTAERRPSDAAAASSPKKRSRTEPRAPETPVVSSADTEALPATPVLDAEVMRALLGQTPITVDVIGTPHQVESSPRESHAQQENASFALTTPEMSFDEPQPRVAPEAESDADSAVSDVVRAGTKDGSAGVGNASDNPEEPVDADTSEDEAESNDDAGQSSDDNVEESAHDSEGYDSDDAFTLPHIQGLFDDDDADYSESESDDTDDNSEGGLLSGDEEVLEADDEADGENDSEDEVPTEPSIRQPAGFLVGFYKHQLT
ncbi:hypothetical protein AAVH_10367, partial [Aphelenchoides avenae]